MPGRTLQSVRRARYIPGSFPGLRGLAELMNTAAQSRVRAYLPSIRVYVPGTHRPCQARVSPGGTFSGDSRTAVNNLPPLPDRRTGGQTDGLATRHGRRFRVGHH